MLVDINLLPEKDRDRSTLLITSLVIIGLSILIWLVFFLITQNYEKQSVSTENHILNLQASQEEIKTSLIVSEFAADKQSLESTVSWAENYQFDTVPLLEGLVGLLPDRGFFETFDFIGPNSATLMVQFNTTNEAAYYLTRLQSADFISQITLESVTVEDLEDEIIEDEKENVIHKSPRYLAVYTVVFFDERLVIDSVPETSNGAEGVDTTTEGDESNE